MTQIVVMFLHQKLYIDGIRFQFLKTIFVMNVLNLSIDGLIVEQLVLDMINIKGQSSKFHMTVVQHGRM